MSSRILATLAAFVLSASAIFAQTTAGASATYDAFQINYASHLNQGDGTVNVTNAGTSAGTNTPIVNGNTVGDICANIYVYTPQQELASCCACSVSPNSLHAWPVSYGTGNLLSNVNNTTVLNEIAAGNYSVVIKILATVANSNGTCPSPNAPNGLASGLKAWATHSHPTNTSTVAITETAFLDASLSVGEYNKLLGDCNVLVTQESGAFCPNCITGGLTALATTF